jgi:hypothetical protein
LKTSKSHTLLKKRFLLFWVLTIVASTSSLQAQKDRKVLNLTNYDLQTIHFGFLLGVNSFNFVATPIRDLRDVDSVLSISPEAGMGFSLGIISNLHLGDNFDLRFTPTLSFGERKLIYQLRVTPSVINDSATTDTKFKSVESTFLEFPVLLKFKSARLNNGRAYVIGGVKPVIDLASQDKVDDKGEKILKLKKNDLNCEIGFGIDFYTQYFKFTPEFKMSYGLNNLLVQDNNLYTSSLQSIRSKAFYISFTFE